MSEQKTFQFDIVSPAEKLISEPATYAALPGSEGEFGVLPGHSALISTLKCGVVKVKTANDNEQEIFIAGGFADVSAENVTILAEEAVPVASLDKTALETDLKNLEEDITLAEGAADKTRLQTKIDVVKAKLAAL